MDDAIEAQKRLIKVARSAHEDNLRGGYTALASRTRRALQQEEDKLQDLLKQTSSSKRQRQYGLIVHW